VPIEITWYVEKRVLYQRFTGVVTLEDFVISLKESRARLATGIPLVHTLVDTLTLEKYPPLRQLTRHMTPETGDNTGWTIIMVNNPLMRFAGSVLSQIGGSSFTMTGSLAEALAFLRARDGTLDLPDEPGGLK
jgi:hypothetical protein